MAFATIGILGLLICMVLTGTGNVPFSEEPKLPVYEDNERKKEILERAKRNPELLKAYSEALSNKDIWTKTKVDEYLHDNVDKTDISLGKMYSLKDFRVKKTYEQDLQVKGGTIDVVYHPIDSNERIRMRKHYRTVHLDGIEVNCESLMPKGSEGFAILTLYDERFVSQEKGFLGLIGFPLSHGVSKASLKVNYSISTFDEVNWVAVITVYDHNLRDDMRPCNFHLKAHYKYTNNVSRFLKNIDETEVGSFKIKIQNDKKGFAEESIRNSLDYSMSVLTNKKFMKKLSERELNCLRRCKSSFMERGRMVPNYEASCSTLSSNLDPNELFKNSWAEQKNDTENNDRPSCELDFKINFEDLKDNDKEKFLMKQLDALKLKGKCVEAPRKLKL
ncbi:movement protein [Grapevine Garan dmak virus]|uniref:Movement protein n=1 Tax=Grapevine Garan dmak virus TaxID=2601258 RepID=A0A5B8MBE9_9VIRU|nr:movement protein [Grapevine Garan dmak virus]QDZ17040.1 movement protein [Grapevine Garan dmak virus]